MCYLITINTALTSERHQLHCIPCIRQRVRRRPSVAVEEIALIAEREVLQSVCYALLTLSTSHRATPTAQERFGVEDGAGMVEERYRERRCRCPLACVVFVGVHLCVGGEVAGVTTDVVELQRFSSVSKHEEEILQTVAQLFVPCC